VQQRLTELYAIDTTIFHHTIHCFGSGESAIEMELPDLIRRGRDPLVGITASSATISLRIATRGASQEDCLKKMQPTIDIIRKRLGDLVYGENGQQVSLDQRIQQILQDESWHEGADVVLLIGPVDRDEAAVASGDSYYDVAIGWAGQHGGQVLTQQFRYSGHTAWREIRAVKDVLNFLRLQLAAVERK